MLNMEIDKRKAPTYEIEVLPNGMKQIGVNSEGLPEYKYYGEGAVIVKETIYILATEDYYKTQFALLAQNVTNIVNGGSNIKIAVNMSGELVKILGGNKLYSGSETFATYPTPQPYIPPPPVISYHIDEGIIGYTINGDALYMGESKGVTKSYTVSSSSDPISGKLAGSIQGIHPYIYSQIVSKSKSNGRVINGKTYYDWSYTEVTWK